MGIGAEAREEKAGMELFYGGGRRGFVGSQGLEEGGVIVIEIGIGLREGQRRERGMR